MVSGTNILNEYFVAHRLAVLSETARRDEGHIKQFLAELDVPIEQADRSDVLRHIGHLAQAGASAKTIHNHVASISSYFRWLIKGRLADHSPLDGIDLPKIEMPPPIYMEVHQYQEVVAFAEKCKIGVEVTLALNTGLRMTELRFLHWADVDESGRRLKVRRGKGGKFRVVPLNPAALEAMAKQRRRYECLGWVFPGALKGRAGKWDLPRPRGREWWLSVLKPFQKKFAAFRMVAKGRCGRCWHIFRHSFATAAVMAGVPIYTVSQWLGHAHVTTTQRYAHLSPAYNPDIEKVWPSEKFSEPAAIFHMPRDDDV